MSWKEDPREVPGGQEIVRADPQFDDCQFVRLSIESDLIIYLLCKGN